jgi:hypothetical protein
MVEEADRDRKFAYSYIGCSFYSLAYIYYDPLSIVCET